jgi:hypothetical protein
MVTGETQDFGGEWKEIKLIEEEEEEAQAGGLLVPKER